MGSTRLFLWTVLLVCTSTSLAHEQHKPPVKTPSEALSEHQHYSDAGEHDASYDHDMFLGKDEAVNFENLDPKIAKNKLR